MELQNEFDRQVNTVVEQYASYCNIDETVFKKLFDPLKEKIDHIHLSNVDLEKGFLPFVIVVKSEIIDAEKMMSLVRREGKNGVTKLFPHDANDFSPIDTVLLPDSSVYLLVDIDRGKDSINIPPSEALTHIKNEHRSPLTIDEGIAIITHYPDFLKKNNCFSLLGSRHVGDKRVPAIWINADKKPNLGWCWDGNPHTWLGSASCADRLG